MAPITPSSRTTSYSPVTPTTAFPVNFPIADNSDLAVLINGAPRTDFTVAATYPDGLSYDAVVNMNTAVTGTVIILGGRNPRRQNQFQTGRPLQIPDLNTALNTQEIEIQEARRDVDRAVKMPPGYAGLTIDPNIPDGGTLMRDGDQLVEGPNLPDLAASLIADATAQANRAHDEADRAEAARDIAAGYASDAVSQGNVPIYSTIDGMPALSVKAGIISARLNGKAAVGDGYDGLFIRVAADPGAGVTAFNKFRSADRFLPNGSTDNANGGWWQRKSALYLATGGSVPRTIEDWTSFLEGASIPNQLFVSYTSSGAGIKYGYATNVVGTGTGTEHVVGAQLNAYSTNSAGVRTVWGVAMEAWSGDATTAAQTSTSLIGAEPSIISQYHANADALVGMDIPFKNRPDGVAAPFGGLGSNAYNRFSRAIQISSQARGTTGEYCGWRTGILFTAQSIDQTLDGLGIAIDMSAIPASRLLSAIRMPDQGKLTWDGDARSIGINTGAFRYTVSGTDKMTIDSSGNQIIAGAFTWVAPASPTLATNGQVTISSPNNTTLTFTKKGSDGTVRSASLTLS